MGHSTLIQCNCRGFRVNFNELSLLIQNHNPVAICLQETHLKDTEKINIKKKLYYVQPLRSRRLSSGGSSITTSIAT
jgi:exonuclease III